MPQIGEQAVDNTKRRPLIWAICDACGKERGWVGRRSGKPRSRLCRACSMKEMGQKRIGEKNKWWKGGRIRTTAGYIRVRVFDDDFFAPMADASGYVLEHRLVMAKYLSRCLLPWEVVHHKSPGIKDDNRLENLELLPHGRFHLVDARVKGYIRWLENRIRELEGLLPQQRR